MLQKELTYDGFFQSFRWQIPEYDTIGVGPAEIEFRSELPLKSTGKASAVICARMKSGRCRMKQP